MLRKPHWRPEQQPRKGYLSRDATSRFPSKQRFSESVGEQVVEEEMQLAYDADTMAACAVNRDAGFKRALPGVCHVDESRLDPTGRDLAAIRDVADRSLESRFGHEDEMLEEVGALDLADVGVEVGQAVLERETPVQDGRVERPVGGSLAWYRQAKLGGHREGPEEVEARRKIAETFADIEGG